MGLLAAQAAGAAQLAAMQRADFDDSELPAWARMTEEEKRERSRG